MRGVQFLFCLLLALGASRVAVASSQEKSLGRFCTELFVGLHKKLERVLTTSSSRYIKASNLRARQLHHITLFSIEDFQVSPKFLEQARAVFTDSGYLEWDMYLQRQAQIEYLESHLPNSILSQVTETMWSDFYYGYNTIAIENRLLSYLSPESLRKYRLIQPTRRRAISKFNLYFSEGKWEGQQFEAISFEQSNAIAAGHQQDFRTKGERQFKELKREDLPKGLTETCF